MFVVLPHNVYRPSGRYTTPTTYWRVIDRDAGHDENFNPRRVLATCKDKADAEKIAQGLNLSGDFSRISRERGEYHLLADLRKDAADVIRKERDALRDQLFEAREELRTAQDKWLEAREERDETKGILDLWQAIAGMHLAHIKLLEAAMEDGK